MFGKGDRLQGKKNGRWRGGVLCIELNLEFETAKEAAEYLGAGSYSHIVSCCNGEKKNYYGYT